MNFHYQMHILITANHTPNNYKHQTSKKRQKITVTNYDDWYGQAGLDESSQDPETTESTNQEGTQRWPGQRRFKYFTCTICKNERPLLGFQKNFTYAELEDSTAGFSAKSSLYGDDDFGSTFSGQLTNELKMVVMKLKKVCLLQEEFKSEVDVLTEARHENIVMLMGSCSEGNSRLLVYEYICNGSLDPFISNAESKLTKCHFVVSVCLQCVRGCTYACIWHTNMHACTGFFLLIIQTPGHEGRN